MNKVILIGRLAKEPDVEEKYARYTLAVDREFKQEGQPDADFINCVVFGKGVDFVNNYLDKGMKIAIIGRWQTGSYKKPDGSTVYTNECVVEKHEFCESKRTGTSEPAQKAPAVNRNLEDLKQFETTGFKELHPDDDGDLPF